MGRSSRTNDAGIEVLSQVFSEFKVTPIEIGNNALHLKSVCSLVAPSIIIVCIGDEISRAIVQVTYILALYCTYKAELKNECETTV